MNDNFKKQISNIEDLVEISDILAESTELHESISKYRKNPYDPEFSKDGHKVPINFNKKGDTIYLLGNYKEEDDDNSSVIEILYDAIEKDMVTSAHPLHKAGLFCGLIEACGVKKLGFDITGDAEISDKEFLFNDGNISILISVSSDKEGKLVDFIFNNCIKLTLLGHVTKGELRMDDLSFGFIDDYLE
ncbi:MAG: hypothetical protein ABFC28_00435 [Rikenellaceae bacterium]